MEEVRQARRIAVTAAYGGGGLGLFAATLAGVVISQAKLTRRAIKPLGVAPLCADGVYGSEYDGEPIVLALLGDSSMVGYGVTRVAETPGALLGTGLSRFARRPVRIVSAAAVGATSPSLAVQVDMVLDDRPDAALIFIGANDVTHRIRPSVAVGHLGLAVRRLFTGGAQVVVGTCPDLSTILPTRPPLRWIARRWSRQLATAQTVVVVESGGRTVSLTDLLGPEFVARRHEMLCHDRYHPSAAAYARAAEALLPSLAAALGIGPDPAAVPEPERGEGVRSLPAAAVEAAAAAGTEVTPTAVAGRERGPWGRWAELRHRIRVRVGHVETPAAPTSSPPQPPPGAGIGDNGESPRAVEEAV